MDYTTLIKSGTSGHIDSDGCDLQIKEVTDSVRVPIKGETIRIHNNGTEYIVSEVETVLAFEDNESHSEWFRVYVLILWED